MQTCMVKQPRSINQIRKENTCCIVLSNETCTAQSPNFAQMRPHAGLRQPDRDNGDRAGECRRLSATVSISISSSRRVCSLPAARTITARRRNNCTIRERRGPSLCREFVGRRSPHGRACRPAVRIQWKRAARAVWSKADVDVNWLLVSPGLIENIVREEGDASANQTQREDAKHGSWHSSASSSSRYGSTTRHQRSSFHESSRRPRASITLSSRPGTVALTKGTAVGTGPPVADYRSGSLLRDALLRSGLQKYTTSCRFRQYIRLLP